MTKIILMEDNFKLHYSALRDKCPALVDLLSSMTLSEEVVKDIDYLDTLLFYDWMD